MSNLFIKLALALYVKFDLYLQDKLLLSFMLTINTLKLKNEVNHMELLAFLQLKKKSTHQDLKQKDWDSLIWYLYLRIFNYIFNINIIYLLV